ncbi:SPAT7 protein, partial [Chaetorhynchus papuensis]|nr:SPAT7 protein [Chaetorhynchus papuensis]
REEELLYLTFIEDVTNEILRLGIFSNRVLDQLFECYIEENKERLDETKLMHACQDSKTKLMHACQDSETELSQASQEASESVELQESDTIEELEFTSKGHRLRKATKSEEFLETLKLSLR